MRPNPVLRASRQPAFLAVVLDGAVLKDPLDALAVRKVGFVICDGRQGPRRR